MLDPVHLSHLLVGDRLRPGGVAVDATVGRGRDTLFLARQVGPEGRVHGFDVQSEALAMARGLVAASVEPVASVRFHHCGHEDAGAVLDREGISRVDATMFNLGYLPRGDRGLTTLTGTTLRALNAFCRLLAPGGIISVVAYVGHPGGPEERDAVVEWSATLDWPEWASWRYTPLNRGSDRAELLVIERLAPGGYCC